MRKTGMPGELFARAAALVVLIAAVGACDREVTDPAIYRIFEAVSPLESAGTVASLAPTEPTVRLLNSRGTPLAGVLVFFMPMPGSGSVADTSVLTAADGTASAGAWVLGTQAGRQVLSVQSVAAPTVAFVTTAAAGPVARVESAGGDRQVAPAGFTLWNPVRVLDAFDNPVPGAAVTFTVLEGGGRIEPDPVLTEPNGVSTGRWTLGLPGHNRLRAEAGGEHTILQAFACEEHFGSVCIGSFELVSAWLDGPSSLAVSGTLHLLPPGDSFWVRYDTITGSGRFSLSGDAIHLEYEGDFLTRVMRDHHVWPPTGSFVSEVGVVAGDEIWIRRCLTEDCYEGTWVYRRPIVWP
jgi:hypothetical protein